MAKQDIQPVRKDELLSSLPLVRHTALRASIKAKAASAPLLVILDDDPTGTQTCHDILVLTTWDVQTLAKTLAHPSTQQTRGFFILTNSRALHPPAAHSLITEICRNLQAALGATPFELVLRSDSTLRGHFPLEADAAQSVLGPADAVLLAPFFLQGGRYTVGDIHYVAEGAELVPAAQTPFARDASFGYSSSNLREWVAEKSGGRIPAAQVMSLTLQDIREGGPERVCEVLQGVEKGAVVVVNAAAEEDMDVAVLGVLQAAETGKRFLHRSGAALVSARLGIQPIPPKTAHDLHLSPEVGGLVIAGSYVPKTTAQLEALVQKSGDRLATIIIEVEKLLASETSSAEVTKEAVKRAQAELKSRRDVLVMTSRDLVRGKDERESLDIGSVVARALVSFMKQLPIRPRYIIAKGGITSSDMASKALGMRCATVVGQAAPGVPLWRCDEETSTMPGLPFIVFPGNVGGEDTLFEVVDRWRVG